MIRHRPALKDRVEVRFKFVGAGREFPSMLVEATVMDEHGAEVKLPPVEVTPFDASIEVRGLMAGRDVSFGLTEEMPVHGSDPFRPVREKEDGPSIIEFEKWWAESYSNLQETYEVRSDHEAITHAIARAAFMKGKRDETRETGLQQNPRPVGPHTTE